MVQMVVADTHVAAWYVEMKLFDLSITIGVLHLPREGTHGGRNFSRQQVVFQYSEEGE